MSSDQFWISLLRLWKDFSANLARDQMGLTSAQLS